MPPLVDQYGRPIDFEKLREEQAAAHLMGVRTPYGDHPSNGLTPQRLAAILRESESSDPMRYLELAEDMEEKDLHYLSVLGTRKRAVAQLEITVEAASDDKVDVENADFVREWLKRDELEDDLFDIMDAVGKGFSHTEIIWDFSAKQWWPTRLEWRDPRFFDFAQTDRRTPLLRTEAGLEPLSPFKYISHFHKAKSGLPIRGGLARCAAWSWMFKNYAVKDWVIFAEVYGMPLRLGRYQAGASEADIRTLRRAVASLSSDAAAVIPKSMDIDFIDGKRGGGVGGGGGEVYETLAAYLDQQVSKGVLGQTATTDAIAGGHAVGKEHDLVRGDIKRADAKLLAGTLNRGLVRPMIDLNKGAQKLYPRICIGQREQVDITVMSNALEKLVPLGLRVQMSEVRDKIGFSDPDDDAEILAPPTSPAAQVPSSAQQHQTGICPVHGIAHAASQTATQDDIIDHLVTEVMNDWQPLVAGSADGIEQLLNGAQTIEEARDRLAAALENMDVGKLTETLARAGFSASVAGQLGLKLVDD
ncbi:MAG: DUF935 family protein [Rhizobiales bacterium]|nr:DUF935 family protein [Hyphomicrobiales bacterium]